MFKKNKAGSTPQAPAASTINSTDDKQEVSTIIGGTTTLEGDIHFTGVIKVDGKINGNLIAENEHSVLILNDGGQIEGEVRVPNMIINGRINGNVYASEKIDLYPKAQISGDVHYYLLEMEVGAEVNGRMLRQDNQQQAADASAAAKKDDLELESVDNLESEA